MEKDTGTLGEIGNEVMKAIGRLDEATKKAKDDKNSCETSEDEIGSWLTVIGKAILAIFK